MAENAPLLAPQQPQLEPTPVVYVDRRGCGEQCEFVSHFRRGLASIARLTAKQIAIVIMAVSLVIFGNVGQLLALNLWLVSLGPFGGPFTVLTLSATTNAVFYGVTLGLWLLTTGRGLRFLDLKALPLIIAIGFCNATNGVALVFATPQTPEVLQAVLLSSQLIWIFIFVKIAFREKRSYFSPAVILSFMLSLGGITLGMASQFGGNSTYTKLNWEWSAIFAFGMIPGAMYNVVAAKFLRRYTEDPTAVQPVPPPQQQTSIFNLYSSREPIRADGLTVKITMLFTTGVAQAIWMFILLPMDALPWFGTNPDNIQGTGTALKEGYECVFTNVFGFLCKDAFWYYVFFNVSYMLNYVGSAWLNMYSPALTSIVTQLSSPLAALVLIIFPVFNTSNTPYNVGESVAAAIFLIMGSVVYSFWEESTKQQERMRILQQQQLLGGGGVDVMPTAYPGTGTPAPYQVSVTTTSTTTTTVGVVGSVQNPTMQKL
jgi:hypothetical protein